MSTIRLITDPDNFKIYAKIDGVERLTKLATRQGMFLWARDLKSTASQRILAKDKTGRVYIRRFPGGARRRHRASAAGEYHANRSGTLRGSIGWRVTGSDRLTFGYGVDGKPAPNYDAWVEFGTFKMRARPSIQNAIQDTMSNAETYFEEEIKKVYK